MIDKAKRFLKDEPFQIEIKDDSIYIGNYLKLITLEEDRIVVQTKKKIIKITGKELRAKKILNNELLITGIVEKVEAMHE